MLVAYKDDSEGRRAWVTGVQRGEDGGLSAVRISFEDDYVLDLSDSPDVVELLRDHGFTVEETPPTT
jgi:hypothetical protein